MLAGELLGGLALEQGVEVDAFVAGQDVGAMRWSEPLAAIRAACPDVPLTVWCNEDLPLVWPDVLRAVAGVGTELAGEDAILRQIMSPAGFARLEGFPETGKWFERITEREGFQASLPRPESSLIYEQDFYEAWDG